MTSNGTKVTKLHKSPHSKKAVHSPGSAHVCQNKHTKKESKKRNIRRFKSNGNRSTRTARLVDNGNAINKIFPYDARNQKTTHTITTTQTVPGIQNSTIVSPEINYEVLLGISIPVISNAYQGGISVYADARSLRGLPYYAVIYLTKLFESYVLNKTPLSSKVPLFVAIIGNALRPKTVPFKSGVVQYSWQYSENINQLSPAVKIGDNTWDVNALGTFYMYVVEGIDQDTGLNQCGPPDAYTDELGQQSFGILSTFFSERGFPMWKSVSFDAGREFNSDASAFSYPISVLGYGIGKGGAWGFGASNEVPIFHPLLGVFAKQKQLVRYPKYYRNMSGDSLLLSGFLHLHGDPKILKMKNQIVLKAIDFYEIVDVVCRWIVKLFELQRQSTVVNPNYTFTNIGMTYNDLVLLLRSYCIQMFGVTQPLVQSLFPRSPSGDDGVIFIPFLTGSNCHACNDAAGALLPSLLVENLRCLAARSIDSQKIPGSEKKFKFNPLVYLPVLGQFSDGALDSDDYFWLDGDQQNSIFSNDGLNVLVSPVDGTVSNAVYQISNTGYVTDLVVKWNNFVEATRTYSMTVDTQGESEGINALQVITMTNNISRATSSFDLKKKELVFKGRTTNRMVHYKRMLARQDSKKTIRPLHTYDTQSLLSTTSQVPMNKSAWSQIQTYWIKPLQVDYIGNTINDNTDTYSSATYSNEPYILHARDSLNSAANLTSLSELHDNLAGQMVKSVMGGKTQVEEQLIQWGKTGRGGLLSGLVKGLANIIPF